MPSPADIVMTDKNERSASPLMPVYKTLAIMAGIAAFLLAFEFAGGQPFSKSNFFGCIAITALIRSFDHLTQQEKQP